MNYSIKDKSTIACNYSENMTKRDPCTELCRTHSTWSIAMRLNSDINMFELCGSRHLIHVTTRPHITVSEQTQNSLSYILNKAPSRFTDQMLWVLTYHCPWLDPKNPNTFQMIIDNVATILIGEIAIWRLPYILKIYHKSFISEFTFHTWFNGDRQCITTSPIT